MNLELQNSLKENYKNAIEDIKTTLRQAHTEVIDIVDEMKIQLNEGYLINSLKEKVRSLEAAKDQLEEDHKLV